MIAKKYLVYIGITGALTFLIAYYLNHLEHEISNNVTVASEIGVGIIITIIVYGISRKSEVEIETKLGKVFNIMEEREKIRIEQKQHAERRLYNIFHDMEIDILQVLSDAAEYEKLEDPIQKEDCKKHIILTCQHIKNLAKENLDDSTIVSREYFDFHTIGSFKTISSICKNEPVFTNNGKIIDVSFCHTLKKLIDPWMNKFGQELETTREVPIPQTPELMGSASEMTMSTSSDRTVYPLDSTIHIDANIPFLIPGELMIFEIFNAKRKLLLSQKIDPATHPPTSPDSGIFEVSFKMIGDDWKVGEAYIARVTYGKSYSEDSFFIDQRIPMVQSDKSVYTWNSDMILTVIDPDGDKDNDVAEFVGDREDSKLVILSSKGKLVNYRLRETGMSTGIFQGILGFIGVEDDGSITGREVDGKRITKTQGTEIDDGFIEVSKNEELKITYSNRTGIATLTAFVVKDPSIIEETN